MIIIGIIPSFNRTFMELKYHAFINQPLPAKGFNRTFMELKWILILLQYDDTQF